MNKTSSLPLIVALIALGVSLFHGPITNVSTPKKETVYERVMRTRTLRCGYALWPMLTDMDPNTKKLSGVAPDFIEALAKKLNLKIEWTAEVLAGQQAEVLNSDRIDALCFTDGPWDYTEAAFVDYTSPLVHFPVFIYGREGDHRFKTMADLNTPTITASVMDGDVSLALVNEKLPKAHLLELPQSGDPSLLMTNVTTKKADFIITDDLSIKAYHQHNEQKLAKVFDKPISVIGGAFSVRKGQQELLQMLNQGIAILHATGVSDEILDRYDPTRSLLLREAKW